MAPIRKPLGAIPPNTAANASEDASNAPKSTPAKSSKKRKSTDTEPTDKENLPVPENNKKARVERNPEPSAAKATSKSSKKDASSASNADPDILDVSDILDSDPDSDEQFPIFDTCDTVRRKIRALMASPKHPKITQAAFCRAIVKAAYGENSDKSIQSPALSSFLKKKGPLAGNTSAVYYAAYIFFEKLRVKQDKPKSKDREIMEEIWGWKGGVDTKTVAANKRYIVGPNAREVTMDRYGQVHIVYR